jgi:hypothetical protein
MGKMGLKGWLHHETRSAVACTGIEPVRFERCELVTIINGIRLQAAIILCDD